MRETEANELKRLYPLEIEKLYRDTPNEVFVCLSYIKVLTALMNERQLKYMISMNSNGPNIIVVPEEQWEGISKRPSYRRLSPRGGRLSRRSNGN